jgi:tetratricopeptide (TPR) repeat protein
VPRFDRLEFDPSADQPEVPQPGTSAPVRDESYWLKRAGEERRRGVYEDALRHYSRALERDRSLVEAWVGQVQMLIALEEYPEADVWSRKALELFCNNPELLAARAQAQCRLRDTKQAQPLCDRALAQPGLSAYRWMVRGELMLLLGQDIDAYCFDKAEQIDSDWFVAVESAQIYLHYDVPAKALPRARRAVEKAADSPLAWFVRGQCEDELGLTRAALQSYDRCLELVPGHAEAQRRLAALANRGLSLKPLLRRLFSIFGRTAGVYSLARLSGRALNTYRLIRRTQELL